MAQRSGSSCSVIRRCTKPTLAGTGQHTVPSAVASVLLSSHSLHDREFDNFNVAQIPDLQIERRVRINSGTLGDKFIALRAVRGFGLHNAAKLT